MGLYLYIFVFKDTYVMSTYFLVDLYICMRPSVSSCVRAIYYRLLILTCLSINNIETWSFSCGVCVCVCVCVRACVRACVGVCVCVTVCDSVCV